MQLNVSYDFQPKQPSCRAAVVMDHFGVGFETGPHIIADGLELPIQNGDVVCFTGASGSGKSSLMRAVAARLVADGQRVLNLDELELGEAILIEALKLPVSEAMGILAGCGLGEARLLLRTPRELSDGQRYRFRLALAISQSPDWIVADEFSATLDRTLAKVVAFNLRRVADRLGVGFLLATTHEDILADLAPSLHVACRLDGGIECHRPEETDQARKKNGGSVSLRTSTSPRDPRETGRISLGGITEAITWGS
jgi:ABC-type ATPase with predicted acetyltransferase domain